MPRGDSPELVQEVAFLVRSAERVFATRADLRDWLVCAIRRRLHGSSKPPRGQCGAVEAAACAIRFRGECPLSSSSTQLDEVISRLPASRLEALLRLQCDADDG